MQKDKSKRQIGGWEMYRATVLGSGCTSSPYYEISKLRLQLEARLS